MSEQVNEHVIEDLPTVPNSKFILKVDLNDDLKKEIAKLSTKKIITIEVPVKALNRGNYELFLSHHQLNSISRSTRAKQKTVKIQVGRFSFPSNTTLFENTISENETDITSSDDLQKIMNDVPGFLGVYPNNRLNTIDRSIFTTKARFSGIVNLQNRSMPGSHWIGFFKDENARVIEYFDPFGAPPTKSVQNFLYKFEIPIVAVIRQIQELNSEACGYYVTEFIKLRTRGVGLYDFLFEIFTNSPEENEVILDNLVIADN